MKKEWKDIEGKMVRFDVGSTTEQAQAESMPAEVICFTTDNKVVFNGEYFGDGDSFFDVNATDLPSTSGKATFPDDGGERRALYDKLAAACADGKTIRIYLGNGSSGKLYAVACYSEGRKATNRSCFILYFLWGKELYYRFAQWNSTDATYTASASKFTIADASQVAELISRVAADEAAITTNTADIATNTANIAALKSALKGIANTDCARVVITASGNYAVTTNLDALNDFSTAAGLYAITNAKGYVYGHILIGSDPMFHGTVQWLFGNWNVEDGKLMVSHSDGCVTIVYRVYLRSDAKWSDWKYYQQNFIKEADDSLQGGEWTYNHTAIDAIKTSLQAAIDSINTDKQKLWDTLRGVDERDDEAIGELDTAVATNTADIATNAAAIAANTAAIAANAKQIKEDYVEIEANTTRSIVNKNNISNLTDNLRGHAEAITNLTSRVEGDETTIATNATNIATNKANIATNAANIATLNTRVLELGNFATENEAMNALADLSICANQQISVAHLNYTADNTTYSITMLQCLSFDYCRQIIFNRDKMKQRGIKFTDCNRTAIKSIENQQFMFGDRLEWYARENKYVLNQFGSGAFNHSYCQSIPTATSTADGLMSKELVQQLEALISKVNDTRHHLIVKTTKDLTIAIDGESVTIPAKKKTEIYFEKSIGSFPYNNDAVFLFQLLNTKGLTSYPQLHSRYVSYVDVSDWDISEVEDLSSLFQRCSLIENLNVSGWDTSAVTNMEHLFSGCSSLNSLNVSGWDTSVVTNMEHLFSGCSSLKSLDVSGWDTSAVTNMYATFYGCSSLTYLDVSGWDTSAVTNMGHLFSGCSSLNSLNVSGWDTSVVTNMEHLFSGCSSLKSLDVSGLDTSAVTNMYATFYGCSSLTYLDVSGWDTSAVTNMEHLFSGCSSLKSLDVSGWDTSAVTNMCATFYGCSSLTYLDVSGWDTSAVIDTGATFAGAQKLTTIILGPNFFKFQKAKRSYAVSFAQQSLWVGESVRTSLVTNLYDRAANGLATITLQLHANTKAVLSTEDKEYITSKGYIIA